MLLYLLAALFPHPVQVTNLQVLEAMLTGESVPISKNLRVVRPESGLGDRKCMAFSATTVSAGQGVGVVIATGDNAEIGKINRLVSKVRGAQTQSCKSCCTAQNCVCLPPMFKSPMK